MNRAGVGRDDLVKRSTMTNFAKRTILENSIRIEPREATNGPKESNSKKGGPLSNQTVAIPRSDAVHLHEEEYEPVRPNMTGVSEQKAIPTTKGTNSRRAGGPTSVDFAFDFNEDEESVEVASNLARSHYTVK